MTNTVAAHLVKKAIRMLSYYRTSLLSYVVAPTLFITLLLAPQLIYNILFGIDHGASTDFMSRRAAMLFLGTAVLTFFRTQRRTCFW